VEPASIIAHLAAQRLLDRSVDEDVLDDRVLGSRLDDLGVRRRPHFGVDVLAIGGNQAANWWWLKMNWRDGETGRLRLFDDRWLGG
jgi:hypothetical protein